jgi:hypothetical protein
VKPVSRCLRIFWTTRRGMPIEVIIEAAVRRRSCPLKSWTLLAALILSVLKTSSPLQMLDLRAQGCYPTRTVLDLIY